jgi:hypothetical protein
VIYDPTTNAPFAGNIIPTTRINPIASQLMKFYPYPNLPGLTRNYEVPSTPEEQHQQSQLAREPDHQCQESHHGQPSLAGYQ